MIGARNRKKKLALPPGALGRGQQVKYLISVTRSISKIFIPNSVYVLTNERYKTYQMGFLVCPLGHALRGGTWRCLGAKIKFRPAVCPLCYLLLEFFTHRLTPYAYTLHRLYGCSVLCICGQLFNFYQANLYADMLSHML